MRTNDAPPYSPTASANEQGRLPHDYRHDSMHDEDDPLASLTRVGTVASTNPPNSSVASSQSSSSLQWQQDGTRHFTTAPLMSFEPPPDYAPVDALAQTFRLGAPLVYATRTSDTPRYQLMQDFTKSGKPKMLSIRRLMPQESQSRSLPSSSSPPRIRYDEDGTMYTITRYEMRGHRSSTLGGSIQLENGKTIFGKRWTKIFHYTKSRRRDSLNPENQARMEKYGYQPDDEWNKRLMFMVKKGNWEDGEGKRVAVEDDDNVFEVLGNVDGARKDFMVACWLMKFWMGEGMRWDNDLRGW